ncbi:hypothetical protein BJV74DRAFT_296180 [Russula compacta]|nr:hypothetical protein BJV74DRAFT_296180 [Russula compacta]
MRHLRLALFPRNSCVPLSVPSRRHPRSMRLVTVSHASLVSLSIPGRTMNYLSCSRHLGFLPLPCAWISPDRANRERADATRFPSSLLPCRPSLFLSPPQTLSLSAPSSRPSSLDPGIALPQPQLLSTPLTCRPRPHDTPSRLCRLQHLPTPAPCVTGTAPAASIPLTTVPLRCGALNPLICFQI